MKYCLFLLLVLPLSLFAQKQGLPFVDSLKTELDKSKDDTNKVKLLNDISYGYYVIAPDTGIFYGNKALELATRLQWKKGIAYSHNDIGVNHGAKGDHAIAMEHYKKSLKLHEELGNKVEAAGVLTNIAVVYSVQSDHTNSLRYYFKALAIYEAQHNDKARAMVLANIGTSYMEQGVPGKAMEYFNSALELYKKTGNRQNAGGALMNIGILLNSSGKYDEALQKFGEALAIHTELGNKRSIQNTLSCMGDAYNNKKDYAKALDYQQRALKISKEISAKHGIAVATGNIGETWFKLATAGNAIDGEALKNAIGYLSDAVAQCKSINFIDPMLEFQEYLSRAYALSGQHKLAYELLKEYETVKDSIFSLESKMQLANIESKRELELKDKDILLKKEALKLKELELAKKRNDNVLYIVSLLLMLLATAVAIRLYFKYRSSNRVLRKEKEEHLNRIRLHVERIKEQSELLDEISHMQSHDVRGPVATILGLTNVFNKDDYADPSNKMVIDGISAVAHKLDNTIQEIIKKENNLGEGDKEL